MICIFFLGRCFGEFFIVVYRNLFYFFFIVIGVFRGIFLLRFIELFIGDGYLDCLLFFVMKNKIVVNNFVCLDICVSIFVE